ncbi:peptidoglycan DD-metalloendopeptidase family protein [Thioalkalivibrio sp. AKL17]|uniref:peptidoglycan DD-metalloendopeptidase family protein n=1 Tax=Thioalkalivibrio sp. AKL17 TaxID=1158160 RepID=UPI0003752CD8|nr:peptidoglycan DD-metalloendopeptidase family protein [Thioalkalivibrio sp. AKL17]
MHERVLRGLIFVLLAALLAAAVSGCALRTPGDSRVPDTHTVSRGETLYSIASRYGLEWRAVARRNAIGAPYTIHPGQRLRLTGPARSSPPPAPTRETAGSSRSSSSGGKASGNGGGASSAPAPDPEPEPDPPPAPRGDGQWVWPADGEVVRGFSDSASTRQGLGIGGEVGDPVRAARSGEIVYAGGGLVGYGRMIIVRHDERFLSAYGHNDRLLVEEGDTVEGGDEIARLGASGTDLPMLHFEIRVDGSPVDPASYLPDR